MLLPSLPPKSPLKQQQFLFYFKNLFICKLLEREFPFAFSLPDACNSHGWANLNQAARTSMWISYRSGRDEVLEMSPPPPRLYNTEAELDLEPWHSGVE